MPAIASDGRTLLHERANYVWTGTLWVPAKSDASGNLLTAFAAQPTVTVEQATPANLKATVNLAADQNVQSRNYGFLGSAWQKLQFVWSYTAIWKEYVVQLNATAGLNTLYGTAVAAGYAYITQAVGAVNINTNPGVVSLFVYDGVNYFLFKQQAAPGANVWVFNFGEIVLQAGEQLVAQFTGCTLNDDLHFSTRGYKMKIND